MVTPFKTYPSRPSQVPRSHHFAILTGSSHDDGYGGTSDHLTYQAFEKRAEWEAAINSLEQERGFGKDYIAIEVNPAIVERKVIVAVKA